MNKDQKLLEEAYQSICESAEMHPDVAKYIERGCKGDLDLERAHVTSLPAELKIVRGDLNLYKSNIKSLPENLEVQGTFDVSFTHITSLPEGISAGVLRLAQSKIISLPKNLKLRGSLDLTNAPISSLPKGLEVGGILILKGTGIKKVSQLPIDLKVDGIESYDFTLEDFERHKKLAKELSKNFGKELEVLDDFS